MPHNELLYKMEKQFGITGCLLNWFISFLSERQQKVRVGETFSDWRPVTSGVPQGSVLAPLLFIMYVKDMQHEVNHAKLVKFADDTKLFLHIENTLSKQQLQQDLDALSEWFTKWRMPVNCSKSGVLKFGKSKQDQETYSLLGQPLALMTLERDLGILMESKLSFKMHINKIVSKALQIYGWIVRTIVSREAKVLLKIYKQIVRPNLEYASTVWNPQNIGQTQTLEKVQRKITRLILGKTIQYEERLKLLNLPTLKWRRHYLDLLRVYEILHGDDTIRSELFVLNSEVSCANLRRHNFALHGQTIHSNTLKHHFANRIITSWNSLPTEIVLLSSFSLFKTKLKNYLLVHSNPFSVSL